MNKIIIILSLSLGLISAQNIMGGYVTNLPKQLLGFDLITMSNPVGLYIDLKSSLPNPTPFCSKTLADAFGDSFKKRIETWTSINLGITKELFKNLGLYFGIGPAFYDEFCQYYDPYEILGDDGNYWVDGNKSKTYLNILGGLIIMFNNKLNLQLGIERKPFGITTGIGFKIF